VCDCKLLQLPRIAIKVKSCRFKSRRRYTLFLQSWCGYACGDQERSAFGREAALAKVSVIFKFLDVRVKARSRILSGQPFANSRQPGRPQRSLPMG
jgi:hypothetical protein